MKRIVLLLACLFFMSCVNPKWEYKVIELPQSDGVRANATQRIQVNPQNSKLDFKIEAILNEYGKNNWEVIQILENKAFLKRAFYE